MALDERLVEILAIDDLHEDDLLGIDVLDQPLHGFLEDDIGISGLAVGRFRVRVDSGSDVESVEADAKVGSVDELDDLIGLLPGVDVRTPGQVLIRKLDAFGRAQVGDFLQVGCDEFEVAAGDVRGKEGGWDGDDVGAEDVGHLDPDFHFFDALGVPFAVAQAFVVHKGLQTDDGEVAFVAHGADGLGGDEVVGVGGAAREGLGDVEQVLVEQLDVHVVFGSSVELLRKIVDPCAAQGVGGDGCTGKHVCGCCCGRVETLDRLEG